MMMMTRMMTMMINIMTMMMTRMIMMTMTMMLAGCTARESWRAPFGFGRRQRPAAHAGHHQHDDDLDDDDDNNGFAGVHAVRPDPQPDWQDLGPWEDARQQEGGAQEDRRPSADWNDQQVEYFDLWRLRLMPRSGLETTKLELLSEVSGLKLRQVLKGKNVFKL